IKGIPQQAFCMDKYALCYSYIPGLAIRGSRERPPPERFFVALEELVEKIHAHNIVHLDIRYRNNILIMDNGDPAVIDFQSYCWLNRIPSFLHRPLKEIDLSGVYKRWNRTHPGTLGGERLAILERINRKRRYWPLKGYLGIKRSPGSRIREAI
ncbi:MAG: hypothetical protein V3T77_04160, partial [Planctomycetota bacterium]